MMMILLLVLVLLTVVGLFQRSYFGHVHNEEGLLISDSPKLWSTFRLQKLIGLRTAKKLPSVPGIRRIVTVSITARYLSLS